MGTSLIRKRTPPGPYSRTMPRGVAVSYKRGTPVYEARSSSALLGLADYSKVDVPGQPTVNREQ